MEDLGALTEWCDGLLSALAPAQRRQLLRQIAQDMRRANMQRIKAQKQPDGTAFVPRKGVRGKKGRIKGAMFAKLRTARFFEATATADEASAGFSGRVGRIARVHQEGLRDRVKPGGAEYLYPRRALLGLDEGDRERIRQQVLAHLADEQ